MSKISYLTQEGYDKIRAELDDLKTRGRQEASAAIAEAREKGDISENAEYDAAKDAQGMLEMKISDIEKSIANAQILDESKVDTSQVGILTRVKIKNLKMNKEMEYKIVSESEANLKEKKISVDSPIGRGLMGKKRGEVAEITTPAGVINLEILDITI
jgi:transcription elongation factor GreA